MNNSKTNTYYYIEGNQMMNTKYMRYSPDVDRNFIDRPHQMIRHCMLQKSIEEKMDQTGIRMTDVGKFKIQCFKNYMNKIHYLVFGNDCKLSSCSCHTWKISAYLCKHFCSFSEIACLELGCSFRIV